MQVEVGAVVEGTVTGITKFGAFVSLPDGKSGLVHISEIANTYVSDVNEFLKLGDKVKVRVLAVTPDGKINLSIKKAEEAPARPNNRPMNGSRPGGNRPNNGGAPRAIRRSRQGRSAVRAGMPRLKTGSSSSCRSRTAVWPETASITTVRAAAAAAAETDAVKSRAGAAAHEIRQLLRMQTYGGAFCALNALFPEVSSCRADAGVVSSCSDLRSQRLTVSHLYPGGIHCGSLSE